MTTILAASIVVALGLSVLLVRRLMRAPENRIDVGEVSERWLAEQRRDERV
jgi:hypothetical protein